MNLASHGQSIAKAFTWRATAGLDTVLIGYLITGHVGAAMGIAGAELATKSVLYYLHERAWHNLPSFKFIWGKKPKLADIAPWGDHCRWPMTLDETGQPVIIKA